MIKNKNWFLALSIIGIISVIITYYLLDIKLVIVTTVLTIVFIVLYLIALILSKDENRVYESKMNEIFKIYDEILIKTEKVPSISKRNLVIINNIDDLIKSQKEIRKPIYYFKDISSCTFILLDTKEALVYVLKKNDKVVASIDAEIQSRLKKEEKGQKNDYKVLEGIERTTIIRIDEMAYKVSPIRDVEIPKMRKK